MTNQNLATAGNYNVSYFAATGLGMDSYTGVAGNSAFPAWTAPSGYTQDLTGYVKWVLATKPNLVAVQSGTTYTKLSDGSPVSSTDQMLLVESNNTLTIMDSTAISASAGAYTDPLNAVFIPDSQLINATNANDSSVSSPFNIVNAKNVAVDVLYNGNAAAPVWQGTADQKVQDTSGQNTIIVNGKGSDATHPNYYSIVYKALNGAGAYAYDTYLLTNPSASPVDFINSLSATQASADVVSTTKTVYSDNLTSINTENSDALLSGGPGQSVNFDPTGNLDKGTNQVLKDFIQSTDSAGVAYNQLTNPSVSATTVSYTATGSTAGKSQKVTVQVLDSKGNAQTPKADGTFTLSNGDYHVVYSVTYPLGSSTETMSSTTDLTVKYYTLPFTGGTGLAILATLVAAIVAGAIILYRRKKSEETTD